MIGAIIPFEGNLILVLDEVPGWEDSEQQWWTITSSPTLPKEGVRTDVSPHYGWWDFDSVKVEQIDFASFDANDISYISPIQVDSIKRQIHNHFTNLIGE